MGLQHHTIAARRSVLDRAKLPPPRCCQPSKDTAQLPEAEIACQMMTLGLHSNEFNVSNFSGSQHQLLTPTSGPFLT
jgi:hypothetical protein